MWNQVKYILKYVAKTPISIHDPSLDMFSGFIYLSTLTSKQNYRADNNTN